MMIKDTAPNNQNAFRQIPKLLFCIFSVFLMALAYAKYGSLLSVEWLSESILFGLLAGTLWLYRVDNCWKFMIDGHELSIRLSYNVFLRGNITVAAVDNHKIYTHWLQKGVALKLRIAANDYLIELKKSKNGNFFTCSINTAHGTED